MSTAEFTKRLIIVGVFILIGALLYGIVDLLLILFGAVMFAVVLSAGSNWLHRRARLPRGLALALIVVMAVIGVGTILFLFGSRIEVQGAQLVQSLPGAFDRLHNLLGSSSWGPRLISEIQHINLTSAGGDVLTKALGAVSSVVGVVTNVILVFFGSLYLAAQPDLYVRGVLSLLPKSHRARGAEVMAAIDQKLLNWLLGQFVAMAVVGIAFGTALSIIGVPSAIVLGIIAGLLEFIPLIGPVLATIPALLEALTLGFGPVIWVFVAFLVIQQIESNLLVPYVQKRAVELPPVIGLFATVIFSLLFGAVGLIFAVPLVVTIMIAVQEIYVKDILGGGVAKGEPAAP